MLVVNNWLIKLLQFSHQLQLFFPYRHYEMSEFSRLSYNDANVSGTDGQLFIRSRCMLHLIDTKLKYCPAPGFLEKSKIL